jgi:hypothetical protein
MGSDDARALSRKAGFDAHLVKPVEFDVLNEMRFCRNKALRYDEREKDE